MNRRGKLLTLSTFGLLFAAFAAIWHAADRSLWFDEAWTARLIISPNWWARVQIEDYSPPLYYVTLRLWTRIAGTSDLALRFPSLMSTLIALALSFRIAVDKVKSARAGLIAVLILSVTGFTLTYAQEARMYAMTLALSAASMLVLSRWDGRRFDRHAAFYVLATAALLYTHYTGIFIVAAQNVWKLFEAATSKRPRRLLRWIGLQALTALLYIPWLPILINQAANPEYGDWHFNTQPTTLATLWETLNFFAGGQWFGYGALIIIGLFLINNHAQARLIAFLLVWWLGTVAFGLIANLFVSIHYPRNVIGALPAATLLITFALTRTHIKPLLRAFALAALIIGHIRSYNSIYRPPDPGYRIPADVIAPRYEPGDRIYIRTNAPFFHDLPLGLYIERMGAPQPQPWPGIDAVPEGAHVWLIETLPVDNAWLEGRSILHQEHAYTFQVTLFIP